jgi:hypothetical protein
MEGKTKSVAPVRPPPKISPLPGESPSDAFCRVKRLGLSQRHSGIGVKNGSPADRSDKNE